MAVSYTTYVYSHMPNDKGIALANIFTGSQIPRHKLVTFMYGNAQSTSWMLSFKEDINFLAGSLVHTEAYSLSSVPNTPATPPLS